MVKITNITDRVLYRRTPSGQVLCWDAGETRDVESKRLIEELDRSNGFKITTGVNETNVGAGVKTGVRKPKSSSKPTKSKSKPKKEVKSKVQEKVDKALKKPKGLKKSKRAD